MIDPKVHAKQLEEMAKPREPRRKLDLPQEYPKLPYDSKASRAMWCAVLGQAVADYRAGYRAAAAWIFHPSQQKSFYEVCSYAGMDPGELRSILRARPGG
jgi:hypothetical protein